jgi:hypothetical protein
VPRRIDTGDRPVLFYHRGVRFLRRVHAEWLLIFPRLTRTRFGVSLLALGLSLVWLRSRGLDPLTVALQAGALGAVIGGAYAVADTRDRVALGVALTHPTTPLAVATGRYLAAVIPAAGLVFATTLAMGGGWQPARAAAGVVAAAAVGSCALAAVVTFGNAAAFPLFLFMAGAGAIPPERLVDLAHPGVVRLAAAGALELSPALWHYRDIAAGDVGAIVHGLAWAGLGVLVTSAMVARQRVVIY